MKSIKISEVDIKEFKAIKDLKTKINGCNVFLRGKNGVGKSSFMDFIEIALGKSSIVPPNTNIEGQVIIDKDGRQYTFDVKIDKKTGKPKVTVTLPEGTRDTSKSVIAGIVGINSFDVDNFVNLSLTDSGRKKQVEEFKKFLDEETRLFLAKYEASVKVHFDERTELNRDVTKLEGSIKLHPLINHIHELHSFTETKIEAVMEELKTLQASNEKITKVLSNKEQRAKDIDKAKKEIKALQDKIDAYNVEIDLNISKDQLADEWLKENTIKPVDELETKITDASEDNKKFDQAQALIKDLASLELMKTQAGEATALIESERQTIQDAIRDMNGPIEGLAFDETQLLYKGIPVHPSSLSKSEIKRLGIRLKIAENPDLPLFIHEAECMDEYSLKEVQDLVQELGLQMFAEEVQRGVKNLTVEIMAQ